MATIEQQLEWEETMLDRGVSRFRNQQEKAKETRAHETSAGSRLMKSYVIQVSDQITMYLNREHPDRKWNRISPAAKLLKAIDPDKAAMFALREVIGSLFTPQGATIQTICINIGAACEDELQFSKFQAEYKEYYDTLIRQFEQRNTSSYKHKRRVLAAKSSDKGMEWQAWTRDDCFSVGSLVLSLLMEVCDLVEKVKVQRKGRGHNVALQATEKCIQWIEEHDVAMELVSPDRMPCIVQPDDWTTPTDGGYYSPRLRARTPMIKQRTKDAARTQMYADAAMPMIYAGINRAQRTKWRVNGRILDTMQEVWKKNLELGMPRAEPYVIPDCPLPSDCRASELDPNSAAHKAFNEWKGEARELYTLEKERVAKNLALVRTLRLAREMREHEGIWFVYQCDFRGRLYSSTTGLSPQGTDQSKALLEFGTGHALGDAEGIYWFLVNGANKYGDDKGSFDERVANLFSRAAEWKAIAADPVANRSWAEADKPYQFLAWCFEFGAFCEMADNGRGHEFRSHLSVGMDGSCNGLQHFSAMLRDEIGGAAVNLTPNDRPADIYQTVADVTFGKLLAKADLGEGGAINWVAQLGEAMSRKLTKTPVMTLPYGSTQQACTASIYKWATENAEFERNTVFRHSMYLEPILWSSIGEVVVAARAAMDWLQDASTVLTKAGQPIRYNTPLGFPVLQGTHKVKLREIETQIGGRLRLKLATPTKELDSRKQRQGSAPNFVHSIDATHMFMAVNRMGDTDFALIHDDFGVPANRTAEFRRIIQETFYELHTDNDCLALFRDAHSMVELAPLPAKGSLDLSDVLRSPYFFG